MTDTFSQQNDVVDEIDRIMEILPESLIGEYLKFDTVCDWMLDLRQLASRQTEEAN